MSQAKLDRNPSILSCFPERFSSASVQNSSQSFTNGSYLHGLSPPMTSIPQNPVDKHLVREHQILPLRTSSFGPSPLWPLPSPQTVSNSSIDHKSSTIAAPPVDIPNKIASGPLPVPLPPLPSFLNVRNKTTSRLTLYSPLYQAAMKGDWGKAYEFLRSHPGAVNVRITKEMDTVLHIAAGAKQTKFVEEVVKVMSIADLALRNKYNNTALCYAAASGVTKMAGMMVSRNRELPGIRNNKGVTPLYIAALFGHRDMVWYLYSVTSDIDFTKEDSAGLLFATIQTNLFDVALSIIQKHPELAIHRDSNGETPLHVLARKPSVFASKSGFGAWQRFIYPWTCAEVPTNPHCPASIFQFHSCQPNQASISLVGKLFGAIQVIAIKVLSEKKLMHIQALGLVKLLWEQVLLLDDAEITEIITSPSNPLFTAAELGILEFITELVSSYPDLIWKVNEQSQSIFHIAVLQRQEKVFNLIHEIGAHKDMITSYKGINNQNMLHLAGKLAPVDQLNIVSGAALQMQRELLWFKEVEKTVQPLLKEIRDKNEKTPRMLFKEEHRDLVKEGEKWMKSTASSCMLVATLITTVMFAAIFTVPGGNDDNKGTPIFLSSKYFLVFAIADAFALFSSVTSILMFLSILTSRYAEEDFLETLPKRLVVGLVSLFCSIVAMLAAFAATFFIVLGQQLAWIAVPVALISFIPVTLFALLQFPLLADTINSTYGAGIFARKSTEMLY